MKTIFCVLTVFAFSTLYAQNKKKEAVVEDLFVMMQGHYTSQAQSESDSTYFNISLRMTPIWKDRGRFLYVEQAMFGKEDKPYRVRIYKIFERDRELISEIYTLKEEKKWIGQWRVPENFDKLTENEIELKNGCEVVLKKAGDYEFIGKTGEKTCPSELRGAAYATSEVKITPTRMISWDRGFNYSGIQVWGAEKGGYIFDKVIVDPK
jgi:CpeT protein